jgi:hypothetical protein
VSLDLAGPPPPRGAGARPAGRLLIAGDIEEVLPLDAADLLDAARPITADGRVRLDLARVAARRDGQVATTFAHGLFALVILGGLTT